MRLGNPEARELFLMVLGDLRAWASRVVSVDERLLERIAIVWPACLVVLSPQSEEDTITINLVKLLDKDPIVRKICHWVEYQFEPFGIATTGESYSKGKIDIAVILDRDRERYLAYECKRLNVMNAGKRSSLATLYVTQGMMRFITEQYAEGLPMGCMLGYVMDGDQPFAISRLTNAILGEPSLNLVTGPTASISIQNVERFSTTHNRTPDTTIELRHALLPFPIAE
jgi:hypothetical protein